jgi:thiamine biosynthesis lipoprotein
LTRSNPNWLSLTLVCTLFLAACGGNRSDHSLEFYSLGTEVTVTLFSVTDDEASRASRALQEHFARVSLDWYPWSPGELQSINTAIEMQHSVTVSTRLATVIRRAAKLERLSNNRFNAGLGKVTELWGLHEIGNQRLVAPDIDVIASALAQAIGVTNIRWIDDRIVGAPPGLMLDLGGIAKGAILEDSAQLLQDLEIANAIINIGGDLTVIGDANGRPASIGIRSPFEKEVIALANIAAGETIVTSGDYERFVEIDGERYAHILNPRTGFPVRHTSAVTVIHRDAMLADAAATALMVGGAEEFDQLTEALGLDFALLIDASGELSLTEAMDLRLNWLN